jgi:hypothetical protein
MGVCFHTTGGHLEGVSMDPVSNKVCAEVRQHAQSLL